MRTESEALVLPNLLHAVSFGSWARNCNSTADWFDSRRGCFTIHRSDTYSTRDGPAISRDVPAVCRILR